MKNDDYYRTIRNLYNRIEKYSEALGLQNFASLSHQSKDDIFSIVHLRIAASDDCQNNVQEKFLHVFFSILHAKGLSLATGDDAVIMYRIYNKALQHYPQFEECSYDTQISILHEAFLKGRVYRNHDIYVYAKETFLVFAQKGLIDSVVAVDRVENTQRPFSKIWEKRADRKSCIDPSEVWEYNALIYVTYEYKVGTGATIRTSFHPCDLWCLLSEHNVI